MPEVGLLQVTQDGLGPAGNSQLVPNLCDILSPPEKSSIAGYLPV
ncbi:hypothetical protein THTE_3474 [Thermogutta terrifontis]|uniref:Uncharacterized protein n=1 Tax=Thermogutta terrifontis TaxID=1331910 RepID=A0A286RJD8_9BACT|nr:hypothetical protein THTE_3474 [Thermogutta terrifontis]